MVTISGSLRKGSFNTALVRALPKLAPSDLHLSEAPRYMDVQAAGFPDEVTTFADAIRKADGEIIVSPEYNWPIPGGV